MRLSKNARDQKQDSLQIFTNEKTVSNNFTDHHQGIHY